MKRVAIDMTDEYDSNSDFKGRVIVDSLTWDDFIELAERFDLWDYILSKREIE